MTNRYLTKTIYQNLYEFTFHGSTNLYQMIRTMSLVLNTKLMRASRVSPLRCSTKNIWKIAATKVLSMPNLDMDL